MAPKYSSEFLSKVKLIASKLNTNYLYLLAVMNKETGGTFSPSIKNPKSTATGLIQFMDKTAKALGTSTKELAKMSAVKQLDYVYKYLLPYKGKLTSFLNTYLAVFYPSAINKPDNWSFPNKIYAVNRGIDVNKDGKITISDFKQWAGINSPDNGKNNNDLFLYGIIAIVVIYAVNR